MNNHTEILEKLKLLNALSQDGAAISGRYLEMTFVLEDRSAVDHLLTELEALNANLEAEFVSEQSGSIVRLSFKYLHLDNVDETFKSLFNRYFKLAVKGELSSQDSSFFIMDKNFNYDGVYNKFIVLQQWVQLFKDVTRNYSLSNNDNKLSIYILEEIESDKKIKTHELLIENNKVLEVFDNISDFPLSYSFGEDETHAVEKKLVVKSALLKAFKRGRNQDVIINILKEPTDFNDYYITGYEYYINKYSFDKFFQSIEISKIEYFEKINAIIHDNQAKALSIPVVILGTSLLRSWNVMSAILIFTAMVLALYLVTLNLEHKISAIRDCMKSSKRVLYRLNENSTDDYNLKHSSKLVDSTYDEIKDRGTKAIALLKNIRFGVFMSSLVWLIYMVCFYLNSQGSGCPLSG